MPISTSEHRWVDKEKIEYYWILRVVQVICDPLLVIENQKSIWGTTNNSP